ncbi:MAG: GNAT family N-acetyltransferase [Gammaproteobacteria bacterium]|nr:MAG: GNAT family N-acetyltransferase [Gammaproteobacteria bacterium]
MIRKFQTKDTDAVVAIWRSANSLAHPFLGEAFVAQEAINLRTLYLPNAETWVLEDNETPVGFIALIGDEIGGLFLEPSLHGRGLGKTMVDHAVDIKGSLRVEVFEKNTIGRRFYERYGFVEVGKYRHEASGEMTLKLALSAG